MMGKWFAALLLALLFITLVSLGISTLQIKPYIKMRKLVYVKRGYVVVKDVIYSPSVKVLTFTVPSRRNYKLIYLYPLYPNKTGIKVIISANRYKVILPPGVSNVTIYKLITGVIEVSEEGVANLTLPLILAPLECDANVSSSVYLPSKPSNCSLTPYNETVRLTNSTISFKLLAKPATVTLLKVLSFKTSGPAWFMCKDLKREAILENGSIMFVDEYLFVNKGWGEGNSIELRLPLKSKIIDVRGSLWEYREGLSTGGYFVRGEGNHTVLKVYLMASCRPGDLTYLRVSYRIEGSRTVPLGYYTGYPVLKARGVIKVRGRINKAPGGRIVTNGSEAIYDSLLIPYNNTANYQIKLEYSISPSVNYIGYLKAIMVLVIVATPLIAYAILMKKEKPVKAPEILAKRELLDSVVEYYSRKVEILEEIVEESRRLVKGEIARNAYRLWRKKASDELKYITGKYGKDLEKLGNLLPSIGSIIGRLKYAESYLERLTYQMEALAYDALRGAITKKNYEGKASEISRKREGYKEEIFRLLNRLREASATP